MSGFTNENLASVSKSLMVLHGAGLGILLSLIGAAIEHPPLFDFITLPLVFFSIGFISAFVGHYTVIFDPPPDHRLTRLLAWLPILSSGLMVLAALVNGAFSYFTLAAPLAGWISP